MAKAKTTAIAKVQKASKVKVIKATSPEMQLQMLFSQFETDQQRTREIQAELKLAREEHKSYAKLKEMKSEYETGMREVKQQVDAAHAEAIEELAEIKERKEATFASITEKAMPALMAGRDVNVRTDDGREHGLKLVVKVVSSAFQAEGRDDDGLDE